MATLEKIRNKAGLLVIVVGLALFAFIIGDFLNSGSTFFRQTHEKVAEVDGEVINIQDYQERVEEMIEVYKMQTGNTTVPEEYMINIRQTVFDSMVQEIILDEAMAKIGMTVGPDEIFDMVQGENISPVIQQMQIFVNPQTGYFDKNALLEFLKQINRDVNTLPREQQAEFMQSKLFWLFIEKTMIRQRAEQKYTTLLSKAITANALDAKASFDDAAVSSDIAYTMQSYSTIPDSTINISKAELEKLYKERKESFKQNEAKVFKYIAVDIRPSQEDYEKVSRDIEGVKEELVNTTDVASLVNEYSEVPYLNAYFSASSLDPEVRQFVATAEIGDIYGPVFENDRYRMFKLLGTTVAPDSVNVSQIVIPNIGDEARVAHLTDSLINVLQNGGDFTEIAQMYSMDRSAEVGGLLGWVTEAGAVRYLGDDFKIAAFSTPVNKLTSFKSAYGATYIIKVNDRTSNVPKYNIAEVEMTVTPSSRTYSNLYNDLNGFISKNRDVKSMEENAKDAGYNLQTATVSANDQMVGAIRNSRQVVRWAFQHKKGDVSDIMECDNAFVVAAMEGTIREGYRSLASVENTLRSELMAEKKGAIIKDQLLAKNLNSLNAYATAMDSPIDTVRFINFTTRRISGIGVEPKLNAAIELAKENQVSQPVVGNNGVYVFDVIGRNQDIAEYVEADQINSIDAGNSYRFGYQAIQSLVNKANVKDNRIRFY